MRHCRLLLLIIAAAAMSSCGRQSHRLGVVHYYPSFLWKDACTKPVEKTLDFDFSEDARNDPKSFAEFQFVDNAGRPVSTDTLQVSVDGQPLKDNILRVGNDITSVKVTFTFAPDAETRDYQGTLKLIRHDLDRIDSQPLTAGQQVDVMPWSLRYERSMNPLAKGVLWTFITIIAALLLWFLLLKRLRFPTFRGVHKMTITDPYFSTKSFQGRHKIVLCATPPAHEQSTLSRWFKGEVVYEVNPIWETPLEITPDGKTARVSSRPGYLILPADGMSSATKWTAGGEYIIEITDKHIKAKIQVI